jgi:hypothetical protein
VGWNFGLELAVEVLHRVRRMKSAADDQSTDVLDAQSHGFLKVSMLYNVIK